MLVLSRKAQEQIRIGDSVVLTVLSVKGNAVRVGIEAPKDIRIVRGELKPLRGSTSPAPATTSDAGADAAGGVLETADEAEEPARKAGRKAMPVLHNRISGVDLPLSHLVSRPR